MKYVFRPSLIVCGEDVGPRLEGYVFVASSSLKSSFPISVGKGRLANDSCVRISGEEFDTILYRKYFEVRFLAT